jgi:membrane protein
MVGFFTAGQPVSVISTGSKNMADWREKTKNLKEFLNRGIWEVDPGKLSKGKSFLLHQVQVISLAARDFFADHCLMRASALTYTTILSIVPMLALMFSLLKGLGVQNKLEPLLLDKLAVGSGETVTQIISYINNTNVGKLGTVGLVLLIFTVLTVLSNIEVSFNSIWGVKETRPLFRRFSDYLSVVLTGPIFILAAISMTTTLESQVFVQKLLGMAFIGKLVFLLFKILPFVAMWAAFTFLYIFMPNTRVQFRAALVGGIFGGTLWQVAQWGYVTFQVGVARYNAIYGTMAAVPIFMVWTYFSWVIVLLGLELTYATQNLRTVRREIRGGDVNFTSREIVALNILLVVGESFKRGERPLGQEEIGEALELPPRLARSVLATLVHLGLVSRVQNGTADDFAYQPALALENMKVFEIIQALREEGENYSKLRDTPEREVIREVERTLEEAGRQALKDLTMEDLVVRMTERKKAGDNKGQKLEKESGNGS